MRLKWQANFNIEDSTVQLSDAFIRVVRFENVDSQCNVEYIITDYSENTLAKYVKQTFDRTFVNESEVYNQLLLDFTDSQIVD